MSVTISKTDLLMHSLFDYFHQPQNLELLLPIIQGHSTISLRVIDWFVTNYSKKNNISYVVDNETNQIVFDTSQLQGKNFRHFVVYLDYKLQLKGYQKKQFDPFCRRSRIDFGYEHPETKEPQILVTTIGQLNFFKWAISNQIISYINHHLKVIEQDMNSCYKAVYNSVKDTRKKTKEPALTAFIVDSETSTTSSASNSPSRRKRQPLSNSASKSLSKTNVKVIVSFD